MRIFGGERLKKTMERIGMKPGECIEHSMVSKRIAGAQEKVERHNFDIRKHLLEYDDVLNQQRTVIYKYRSDVLEGAEQIQSVVKEMITDAVHNVFAIYCPGSRCSTDGVLQIYSLLEKMTGIARLEFEKANLDTSSSTKFEKSIRDYLVYYYEQYRTKLPEDIVKQAEKWVLLETIDRAWRIHLQNNDQLKEGIGLRGYGQKNPLIEYKKESFDMFKSMMSQIKWDIVQGVFRMKPDDVTVSHIHEIESEHARELDSLQMGRDESGGDTRTVKRDRPKVGRNDPCPCGSGKKFKKCCGK
jgi:preprotein translocase subunit SecA